MPSASIIATMRSTAARGSGATSSQKSIARSRLAVVLVGGERAPGHRGEDLLADGREPRAVLGARVARRPTKRLTSLRARRVVAHVERAVLADDRVDRPHARDVVAPAGGPAGDRHDELARRRAGARARRTPRAVSWPCVVSVSSMSASTPRIARRASSGIAASGRIMRRSRDRRDERRTRLDAGVIGRPHLVRRHSTSSAVARPFLAHEVVDLALR